MKRRWRKEWVGMVEAVRQKTENAELVQRDALEKEFEGGVRFAHELHVEESVRLQGARQLYRVLRQDGNQPQEKLDEAFEAMTPERPLWQNICRFSPRDELLIDPGERRAGIRRLLRVVERMFRSELKSEDVDCDGGASNLTEGVASFAGRSVVWDPLNEICLYLQISRAKLNALALQRTGLRASDLGDCIRAEKVRGHLKEKLGPLAWQWFGQLEPEQKRGLAEDLKNSAWRFLKWVRGGGRGETRKKLAFELGLTSREKLDRAVLIGERETLEAVEVEIAAAVLREMLEGRRESVAPEILGGESSHGAGCDEVGEQGEGPPVEEVIEEREAV